MQPSEPRPDEAPDGLSLARRHPGAWDVPVLLGLAAALLLVGQILPGVTIHFVVREPERYSVMGGVIDLWQVGNEALAVILFSFSVVFPVVKLVALAILWFRPLPEARRARWCHALKALGKWSMLDTFVVILLVGTVQLSRLVTIVKTNPEPAVYAFGAAILLSIGLTFRVASLAAPRDEGVESRAGLDLPLGFAALGAAACLVAALVFPVMRVEKKGIEHVYSIVEGTLALDQGLEPLLALTLALLVVLLPLAFLIGIGVLCIRPRGATPRTLARLVALERWAMADVFVLALWLVYTKVSGIAEVTRLAGYWAMVAAGLLSLYCAFRVRRVY